MNSEDVLQAHSDSQNIDWVDRAQPIIFKIFLRDLSTVQNYTQFTDLIDRIGVLVFISPHEFKVT